MYEGFGWAQPVDYAAAKAGIIGFTRDAGAELAPYGIRVNAISPGGIFRHTDPEFDRRYSHATALGRMGREGWDLKGAAVFLASDASRYVTCENIVVDGGFSVFKQRAHPGLQRLQSPGSQLKSLSWQPANTDKRRQDVPVGAPSVGSRVSQTHT